MTETETKWSYPSGVPSLKGSSGRMTAGRGSRVHARAQEPGAMVCPTRRAVGVGRVGRSVLPSTLYWWRWKLGASRRSSTSDTAIRLLPVSISATGRAESNPHGIAIQVAGLQVHIEPGTDIAYVAALVEALRSRC